MAEVTVLLEKVRNGDAEAAQELFGQLYGQLHGLAAALFRSQRGSHTLQPTALVHEAYLKMIRPGATPWQDRAHFCGVAARAMRQILVNHARDKGAQKRGGDAQRVTLGDAPDNTPGELDVIAVNEALEELERMDTRQARIAELRFFAGLNTKEISEVLGVAPRTVELDWKMAKDWLIQRL